MTVIAPGPGASEERGAHVLRLAAVPMPFYREVRLVHQLRTLRQLTKRLDVQAAIVLTLGPVGLGVTKWLPPAVRLIHVYTTDMPAYVRAYRAGFLVPVVDEVTRRVARRADATLVPTPMIGQGLAEARVPRLMTWARGGSPASTCRALLPALVRNRPTACATPCCCRAWRSAKRCPSIRASSIDSTPTW